CVLPRSGRTGGGRVAGSTNLDLAAASNGMIGRAPTRARRSPAVVHHTGDAVPLPRRLRPIVASALALTAPLALPAAAAADAAFAPPTTVSIAARPDRVFAGDVDRDGHQDLIVTTRDADDDWRAIAYFGNGDGTLGPGVLIGSGARYRTAAAGDFDD